MTYWRVRTLTRTQGQPFIMNDKKVEGVVGFNLIFDSEESAVAFAPNPDCVEKVETEDVQP